jgi:hypothetical protein
MWHFEDNNLILREAYHKKEGKNKEMTEKAGGEKEQRKQRQMDTRRVR